MEDRVKVVGQPIRPLLLVVPLHLLVTALVCDLAALATGSDLFALVGFWTLALGLLCAAVAGIGALIDLRATPHGSRARRIATVHGAAASAGAALFALIFFARLNGPAGGRAHAAGRALVLLEVLALLVGVAGAIVGGQLARRERVVAATRSRAESVARRLTGRAPVGTRVGRAPVGTRVGRAPVGTRVGRAPVGTRVGRAPAASRVGPRHAVRSRVA
ncbi:DUF2231 domain-containing protein [Rhizomonospora bruguierae]|uniref:DUF2231 domain-containing protein n=1 Tax=Rhizomonospora bruguierae TaxID=1581705 RepID=UPI001BCBACB0|nr:DUF2231 domain-containing protein [Micromonospora sp. NBRC 107566]